MSQRCKVNWAELVRVLFLGLTAGCFSALFPSATERKLLLIVVNTLLAAVFGCWFEYEFHLLSVFSRRPKAWTVALAAGVSLFAVIEYAKNCVTYGWTKLAWFLVPFAWVFLAIVLVNLLEKLRSLPKPNISLADKIVFLGYGAVTLGITLALCSVTNIFYYPGAGEFKYDVIYTSDSVNLYVRDAFLSMQNTQNDLRQMWFPFLALPFAVPAKLLSYLLPFKDSYAVFLLWMQWLALYGTVMILASLMKLSRAERYAFTALFLSVFAHLLFALVVEQYLFPLFWTALFLWSVVREGNEKTAACLYGFSVGGFLTNAIWFPLLWKRGMKWKEYLSLFVRAVIFGMACFVLAGGLPSLHPDLLLPKIQELMGYGGAKLSRVEVLTQYTHYLVDQFVAPVIVDGGGAVALPEGRGFSFVGFAILAMEIVAYFFTKRDKIATACLFWIGFSVLLLGFMGWGASENGMILYSSYFVWAFLLLPMLAIKNLLKGRKWLFVGICTGLAIGLLIANVPALVEIVKIGLRYYPVG